MDIPLILDDMFSQAERQPDWGWKGAYQVGLGGEHYANLDWRDEVITKPTKQAITDAWPAVQKKFFTDVADADTRHQADLTGLLTTLDSGGTLDATVKKQLAAVLRRLAGEGK